jgi:MFS family permease
VTKTTGNRESDRHPGRAGKITRRPAHLFSRLLVDVTPLRESVPFRRLVICGGLSGLGGQMTNYAVLLQVYDLTRSSFSVGILEVANGVPMIVAALLSGPLADAFDRRKIVLVTYMVQTLVSVALAAQAFAGLNQVWVLYLLLAVMGTVAGLASPARRTLMPTLLSRDQLSAGAALQSIVGNGTLLIGPTVAGIITAALGLKVCYLIDAFSWVFSLYAAARLPKMRAAGDEVRPGLRAMGDGLRFIIGRRVILGALLTDMSASLLGIPIALFPAINAEHFGGHAQTLGLMISAMSAGGLLASALSGPASRVRRQGLGLLVAAVAWGVGLAAFGWSGVFWLALLSLAFAGAADITFSVLRTSLIQGATPDNLRGRISGVEFAAAAGAPALGNLRAGAVASFTSPAISAISGGLAVIVSAALIGLSIPAMVAYRSEPEEQEPGLGGDQLVGDRVPVAQPGDRLGLDQPLDHESGRSDGAGHRGERPSPEGHVEHR